MTWLTFVAGILGGTAVGSIATQLIGAWSESRRDLAADARLLRDRRFERMYPLYVRVANALLYLHQGALDVAVLPANTPALGKTVGHAIDQLDTARADLLLDPDGHQTFLAVNALINQSRNLIELGAELGGAPPGPEKAERLREVRKLGQDLASQTTDAIQALPADLERLETARRHQSGHQPTNLLSSLLSSRRSGPRP